MRKFFNTTSQEASLGKFYAGFDAKFIETAREWTKSAKLPSQEMVGRPPTKFNYGQY